MDKYMERLKSKREMSSLTSINAFLDMCKKPYVSWSGGKDSTLMLWLTLKVKPDIKVIYFDADSCLPDGREYMHRLAHEWSMNYEEVQVEPILKTIKEYGLTHRGLNNATMKSTVYTPCKHLMEDGYDGALVGIRAQENRGRKIAVNKYGANYETVAGSRLCWPMGLWTTNEVWAYFDYYKIPYHPAYDKTLFAPREEIRVSYAYGETFRTHGRFKWLQYYYPDMYAKFVREVPEVRSYT